MAIPWLVLARKKGQTINIGSQIKVCVNEIDGPRHTVKLAIAAPRDLRILREELGEVRPADRGVAYLAAPYTHTDEAVRGRRYREVTAHASILAGLGLLVFSPVTHWHPMVADGLPIAFDANEEHCRAMLRRCDVMIVLTLPGWDQSTGVGAELAYAARLDLPIHYHDPRQTTSTAGIERLRRDLAPWLAGRVKGRGRDARRKAHHRGHRGHRGRRKWGHSRNSGDRWPGGSGGWWCASTPRGSRSAATAAAAPAA